MTWDQISKTTSLIVKSSFHSWIFSHARIVPLILHRANIRIFLLVRGKELSILTFVNLYVTYVKFVVALNGWILYHYLRLVTFLFLTGFRFASPFFLKSSHFCTTISIFWRIYLETRLICNFRFPIRYKVYDRQNSLSETLFPIGEMSRLTVKDDIWYISTIYCCCYYLLLMFQ